MASKFLFKYAFWAYFDKECLQAWFTKFAHLGPAAAGHNLSQLFDMDTILYNLALKI